MEDVGILPWPHRNKETATPDQRACQMAKQLNKEKS